MANIQLNMTQLRKRLSVPLAAVVAASWWVIAALLGALVALDLLIFYGYGLEQAAVPPLPQARPFSLDEERIRAAAKIVEERAAAFEAASPAPPNLPNPFR